MDKQNESKNNENSLQENPPKEYFDNLSPDNNLYIIKNSSDKEGELPQSILTHQEQEERKRNEHDQEIEKNLTKWGVIYLLVMSIPFLVLAFFDLHRNTPPALANTIVTSIFSLMGVVAGFLFGRHSKK